MFHPSENYNWVAEFDRRGKDVVTYSCGSTKFENALKENFIVGWGTFSDICFLQTDVACMNVGIGYCNEHSTNSWANLATAADQIYKFKQFYKKYKKQAFVREHKPCLYYPTGYGGVYNYEDYPNSKDENLGDENSENRMLKCDFCCQYTFSTLLKLMEVDGDWWLLCPDCYYNKMFVEIRDKKAIEENTEMYCPVCNSYVENVRICPNCGVFIEQTETKPVYNSD